MQKASNAFFGKGEKANRINMRKPREKLSESANEVATAESVSPNPENSSTPKCEVIIPNRVFVGGIPTNINEYEIRSKFSTFGNVKAVKIIRDNGGISRGYGFVTFSTNEEAKEILDKGEVTIKGRKLNVAPAVKKQFHRLEQPHDTSTENRSDCATEELVRKRPEFYNYSRLNDYPTAMSNDVLPYAYELSTSMESCSICCTSENYYQTYGNPSVNCFYSYPTWVYVPQHALQYPPTGMNYPLGSIAPETIPVLSSPATTSYIGSDPK